MIWRFHSLTIEGTTNNPEFASRWQTSFASLPTGDGEPDLRVQLDIADTLPPAPDREPDFRQGDLLHYFVYDDKVVAHFPRFGQVVLDLNAGISTGTLLPTIFTTYGVIEDLLAISLSPHLRRRGLFLVHAFAAAWQGKGVLLVGGIGAGKTTTGMSLLNGGWQLLSNDSPVINGDGQVWQYPGVLAGYPETFARFPTTAHLAQPELDPKKKLLIPAEDVWADVWLGGADVAGIFFPQIEDRPDHALTPLSAPDTLRRLMPHSVEQWDRAMMPAHLAALSGLVGKAKGYILHLGPNVLDIPKLLVAELG